MLKRHPPEDCRPSKNMRCCRIFNASGHAMYVVQMEVVTVKSGASPAASSSHDIVVYGETRPKGTRFPCRLERHQCNWPKLSAQLGRLFRTTTWIYGKSVLDLGVLDKVDTIQLSFAAIARLMRSHARICMWDKQTLNSAAQTLASALNHVTHGQSSPDTCTSFLVRLNRLHRIHVPGRRTLGRRRTLEAYLAGSCMLSG